MVVSFQFGTKEKRKEPHNLNEVQLSTFEGEPSTTQYSSAQSKIIDYDAIQMKTRLGGGQFGEVRKM